MALLLAGVAQDGDMGLWAYILQKRPQIFDF